MSGSAASLIEAASHALFADGDLAAIPRFFAADYRVHAGVEGQRHAFVAAAMGLVRRAFPQLRVEVLVLVESGGRVAFQRTLSGVQAGPYGGFPASGRVVTWREQVTSVVREGRIAEEWLVSDLAEQLLRTRKATGKRAGA